MEGLNMGIFIFLGILTLSLGLGGFLGNYIMNSAKPKRDKEGKKVIVYVAAGNRYIAYHAQKCSAGRNAHHKSLKMKSAAV